MILLENHIEINIYQFDTLNKYEVIETIEDDDHISFKIFYQGEYVFTLCPKIEKFLNFELSELDKELDMEVDWDLYATIRAALYSVFLRWGDS